MKTAKLILVATITTITTIATSCSKNEDSDTCNEIVCGGVSGNGTYTILRGTLSPDTCGSTEITVNRVTFDYYKSKWDLNPEGYTCWEGLK